MGARTKSLVKLAILLVFIGVAVGFFYFTESGRIISQDRIANFIRSVDPLVARLLYIAVYVVGSVLLLPGVVLSFVGAVMFGVWEGTLYTWIGATIGAVLAFGLARALGRDFVDQLLAGRLRALDQWLQERGFAGLLIVRLVPLFPFNGVNFGCGLTGIRLRDYVLATAIGIVPGTFVYQYLFATLGEKVIAGEFSWEDLLTIDVLLPIGLFALFVLVGGWFARRLRPRASDAEAI